MGSEQKNALIAVVLSGLILFGWQYYFAPGPTAPTQSNNTAESISAPNAATPATVPGPIEPALTEEAISLQQGELSIGFTNGLVFSMMTHGQTRFPFADTVGSERPLEIQVAPGGQGFQALNLATVEKSASKWVGEDKASGVRATVDFNSNEMVNLKLSSASPFKYRVSFASQDKKLENGQQRFFSFYSESLNHWTIGEEEQEDTTVSWAGIDFNYHLFGVVFDKPQTLLAQGTTAGRMNLFTNNAVSEVNLDILYVKKEYKYLTSLGRNLKHAVDFGIWGFFSEILLKGLQFFYTLLPNYGFAIILLTFVVRFLTFPLQYKSFVSMKKMQKIQPELTKLREKFKDDPMRMQKESMDLFKRAGANPMGGCLPMLLQLPVFFAFYKVLGSAVELVDAPFVGWIHDLSNKDPMYVLPLLVTGAMFLQQKMTPTTVADPVQKKVFMFMPLIFGFIMKDLPSGLSLYIFTSTILGIAQQMIVFKVSKDSPVVA